MKSHHDTLCILKLEKRGYERIMQKLEVLEVLIEENVSGSVRPVEVVANAPVGMLVPALVEELQLPQVDAQGKRRMYMLRDANNGSILPENQSLLTSGVVQGARLTLDTYATDGSIPIMDVGVGGMQNQRVGPAFYASETMADVNGLAPIEGFPAQQSQLWQPARKKRSWTRRAFLA